MSDFVEQTSAYSQDSTLPWLTDFCTQARETWQKVAMPKRKAEHWKYTNLRVIEQGAFFSGAAEKRTPDASVLEQFKVEGLESIDLVFVNGSFDKALSTLPANGIEGLELVAFSEANAEQQESIKASLGSVQEGEQHLFAPLNESSLQDGVYLRVQKNQHIKEIIRVIHLSLGQEQGFSFSPRVFVELGESSQATLIEHFASDDGEQSAFVNALTEFDLKANSKLIHYRLHLEQESIVHVGGVHARLAQDSNLDSFQLALGGKLKRIDVVIHHKGKGAHCEMAGVYLPRNQQHIDFHTCIEHAVPHCTTNEVFRGIVGDNAKAVFNGRIHIHKDAQKTLAQLSNKNLLTSNKAEVDTKPELEIYADDVQCAHGATVAQLDDNSMHYLKTRGVSSEEARVMLSFGFINELINQIRHEEIAQYLRPQLAALFARDPELLRHIA